MFLQLKQVVRIVLPSVLPTSVKQFPLTLGDVCVTSRSSKDHTVQRMYPPTAGDASPSVTEHWRQSLEHVFQASRLGIVENKS